MSRKRSRRGGSTHTSDTLKYALLGGVGLLVVALVFLALGTTGQAPPPSDITADPSATDTAAPEDDYPAIPAVQTTVAAAMERLNDPDRTFQIGVVGDSTGLSTSGWVALLYQWMADKYDRPINVHWWDVETTAYIEWTFNGGGSNAPVEIWNGSAGGQGIAYSTTNMGALFPDGLENIDLMFMNHGHNLPNASDYFYGVVPTVNGWLQSYPQMAVVLTKQNPPSSDSGLAAKQASTIDYVTAYAQRSTLPVVDVYSKFKEQPKPDSLIDETKFHPTEFGYSLWFELVLDVIAR